MTRRTRGEGRRAGHALGAHARTLLPLLEAALVIAASTTGVGCSGLAAVTSPGCPKTTRQVEILKPKPGAPLRSKDAAIDAATCRRSCAHPSLTYDWISCVPATVEFEPLPHRLVHCRSKHEPTEYWRPVPDDVLAAAEAEETTARTLGGSYSAPLEVQTDLYRRLCGEVSDAFDGRSDTWSLEPPVPPARPTDEQFVICDVVIRRGCPGPFGSGRAPPGLAPPAVLGDGSLGEHFAGASYFESASVEAFAILADDLRAHGAQRALVQRAHRAARDERAHARATARLSRRFGGRPIAAPRVVRKARTLLEIAIENVVEGCVGETLGAAVALHQARSAADSAVRRAMAPIARDEVRHAALAWAVLAFCEARLSEAEVVTVRAAMRAAGRTAVRSLGEPSEDVVHRAGVPRGAEARAIAENLNAMLWSSRA